jgi:HEAT repeat protein
MTTRVMHPIFRLALAAFLAVALLVPLAADSATARAHDGDRRDQLILAQNRNEEAAQQREEFRQRYAEAQELLNAHKYQEAARRFQETYLLDSSSDDGADALYWEAFSLYREGGKKRLREAAEILELHLKRHEEAPSYDDAYGLLTRIYGQLAQQGDARAAQRLTEMTDEGADEKHLRERDMEQKLMALQALVNMRSERALPILRKVLADRDPAKAPLREQALFLLVQHAGDEAEDILLDVVRNDPDRDVRKQAVFWLSQVGSERSMDVLEEILKDSDDAEIKEQAVFAISQHGGSRAARVLRELALDKDVKLNIRQLAIFWLGQNGGRDEVAFLKEMFPKVEDRETREAIVYGIAQHGDKKDAEWLLSLAFDEGQDDEIRSVALHWACQTARCAPAELMKYYRTAKERELREMIVFQISQQEGSEALDALMEIARTEKDPELRNSAIFWIGQIDDPRVEEFLLKIINE